MAGGDKIDTMIVTAFHPAAGNNPYTSLKIELAPLCAPSILWFAQRSRQ